MLKVRITLRMDGETYETLWELEMNLRDIALNDLIEYLNTHISPRLIWKKHMTTKPLKNCK